MRAALTPELALDYLRALSADVRAGVVLDAGGARLAGPPVLGGPAAAAIAALGRSFAGEALLADGAVLAARRDDRALVLVCGPRVLPELARHDLRLVLGDLLGAPEVPEPVLTPPCALPHEVARALIAAIPRGGTDP